MIMTLDELLTVQLALSLSINKIKEVFSPAEYVHTSLSKLEALKSKVDTEIWRHFPPIAKPSTQTH